MTANLSPEQKADEGAGRDPSGQALAASPSSPSVSPLTGFDPSRVTKVVKALGTTETYFQGGVATTFSDPGMWRIVDGDNAWFFEWSDRWGALRVGPRGETREQPGARSRFWIVTAIWARQGKRVEATKKHNLAVWSQPPAATHYYVKQGRSRVIIRSDEPPGFDEHYSEERYVECDTDGSPEGGDGEAGSVRSTTAGAEGIAKTHPESTHD